MKTLKKPYPANSIFWVGKLKSPYLKSPILYTVFWFNHSLKFILVKCDNQVIFSSKNKQHLSFKNLLLWTFGLLFQKSEKVATNKAPNTITILPQPKARGPIWS